MKRYLFMILSLMFITQTFAADEKYPGLALAKAPIDKMDVASIKRGAKFFATNCMGCHTLVYLRYNKLAIDEGVTYEKMPVNVAAWPNNIKPPDLSLTAARRGTNWLYTYLHSFYQDPSRPSGINNLLVPNTAMPPILVPFQGQQEMTKLPVSRGILFGDYQWYDLLVLTKQGSLSPEAFDQTTADLVNFLDYASEPYYQQQHRLGRWVLGFLFVFFVLTYLLKKEYWKDVKRHKEGSD